MLSLPEVPSFLYLSGICRILGPGSHSSDWPTFALVNVDVAARQTFDNYVLIKVLDPISAENAFASSLAAIFRPAALPETFIPRLLAVNTFDGNELYETIPDINGGFIICRSRAWHLVILPSSLLLIISGAK